MSTHLPDVIDHELATRRKSAIYFAIILAVALFIVGSLLFVLR